MKRRDFIKIAMAGCLTAPSLRTSLGHTKPAGPEVVVLGFDGVDLRLINGWMKSGHLPNLARLSRIGSMQKLDTTNPPNSPVAWSTFATGLLPLEHGVFGFLQRNPATYLPSIAPYAIQAPRFSKNGVQPPSAKSFRKGSAFWELLDAREIPVTLLSVPYAYPPPKLKHGRVLAGLGIPDLRFTNSSFTLFTSENLLQKPTSVAGGRIVYLEPAGSSLQTALEGPRGPDGKYLQTPLHIEIDRGNGSVLVALGQKQQPLKEGQQSQWFPIHFKTKGLALSGRVRFRLLSVRRELRLYASPVQLDPYRPVLPLGSPTNWLQEALRKHTEVPTLGWAHDTSAVNAGVLPKEVFLENLLNTMQARADLLMDELQNGFARILVGVFTGTDRASHIFYKETKSQNGGPLRLVYQAMDQIVGRVLAKLRPGTRLIVLSDHGFHPFDRMLHVNTWLEAQGLLTRNQPGSKVNFLRGVDWAKTKAYSIDTGQLYVNLQGREAQGSVQPGPQHKAVLHSLRAKLLDLRDPVSGQRPVRAVHPVADQAAKNVRHRAPDLQIGFAPGYRSSWATSLGGAPMGAFLTPNPKVWCGDHAASDFNETPGFIATNTKLVSPQPRLVDLSPALLQLFGIPSPDSGNPLFS